MPHVLTDLAIHYMLTKKKDGSPTKRPDQAHGIHYKNFN